MPLQNLNKNYGKMSHQNHCKTKKEYAEDMQNTTKNEEPLVAYVNGYHWI